MVDAVKGAYRLFKSVLGFHHRNILGGLEGLAILMQEAYLY